MKVRAEDYWPDELALIGGLMLFAGQASMVIGEYGLTAGQFTNADLGAAFAAISSLLDDGEQPDALAVFGRMQELGLDADLQLLTEAQHSVLSPASVRSAAMLLTQAKLRRELGRLLGDACEAAQTRDPAQLVDQVQTALTDLQAKVGLREPKTAAQLAGDRLPYYDQLLRGDHVSSAMPTHIDGLDTALNGGLEIGRLYILAARPSLGKSSFALWIALHAARDGHRVLILSLEMPSHEVTDRAVSALGHVSYELIQTGKTRGAHVPDDAWAMIEDGLRQFGALPISVDDQGGLTLAEIRAKAFAVKRRGLKLLVLDYLQLCTGSGENRNAEIETLTRGLKKLAKEIGVAVLVLSQLNRDLDKRASGRPQLSDLRDSGAIEQDADVVAGLWRPQSEGQIGLSILKNRQGRQAELLLNFLGDTQNWAQSTQPFADLLSTRRQAWRGFD